MIIIPDVHGRTFWKQAVEQAAAGEPVIFLGDYLEPYTEHEGITHDQAYANFLEILAYARAHPDTTTLLLGNHDLACIFDEMISCRHDYRNPKRNRRAFADHMDRFRLTHTASLADGRTVVFSHAGIHREWFRRSVFAEPGWTDQYMPRLINEGFRINPEACLESLKVCSFLRGGVGRLYGSVVWADVEEWFYNDPRIPPVAPYPFYQVFGHTQCRHELVTPSLAMLDCRRAFCMDPTDGSLVPLEVG